MAAALMACTEPPRDAVTPHATAGRDALTGSALPPDWAEVLEVAEALDSLPPVTPRGRRGPIDHSGRKQVGHASFYSMGFEGRKMAGGRRFDPNADNAASKTLPFGTTARVTNLENGRSAIVTVEDGCVMGGAGSAVLEALQAAGLNVPVLVLGLPDQFIEHGDPVKLMSLNGLDATGIEASIIKRFGARPALLRPAANH